MSALSETVIVKFCDFCQWAYDVWMTNRTLFDENPKSQELNEGCVGFFARLNIITKEYALHQITKLHDPPVMGGNICLTVGYIVEYGGWEKETYDILKKLQDNMECFSKRIKPARNKILSHNDLKTFISESTHGDFEEGADIKYFEELQKFNNIVCNKILGIDLPFRSSGKEDTEWFLNKIFKDNTE